MSAFKVKLDEAHQRLPLKRLMEQRGRAPSNGNWKSFPRCPYCGKDSSGVFPGKSGDLFKCHHTSCPSGTSADRGAWDEVGFLMHELGLNRRDAAIQYLKEAGVWQERDAHAPSVLPGQRARRNPLPESSPDETDDETAGEPPEDLPAPKSEPPTDSAVSEPSTPDAATSLKPGRDSLGSDGGPAVPDAPPVAERVNPSPAESAPDSRAGEVPLPGPSPGIPAADSPGVSNTEGAPSENIGYSISPSGQVKVDEETIQKFIKYLRMAEKRSITFIEVEGLEGYARATAILQALEAREIIGPAKKGKHRVLPKPIEIDRTPPPSPPAGGDGGGPVPPIGAPPPPPPPPVPPALAALRWFYTRLHFSEADAEAVWLKRGLTPATCAALGFRSNPKENKDLLLEMAKHFPPAVLVDSGLWSEPEKPTAKPKPNPQFYGMSVVEKRDEQGKKVRDDDGRAVVECVWDHPIIIPSFNAQGDLVHLRTHKGMMKDKPARFYVVRPSREFLEKNADFAQRYQSRLISYAVITEGEFKAAAIWQALGDSAAVGALPGITMAKPLFGEIVEWADECSSRRFIVGYDNEEKGDPKLPGYKREEWKRYDSQVWARYLARQLAREGYDGKVCVLPKEWRDARGKADWDGRLAWLIVDAKLSGTPMEIWRQVQPRVKADFQAVVESAAAVNELWQGGFFDSQEERIIKNQLEKISYDIKLPVGGDNEIVTARRLFRLAAKLRGTDRLPPKRRGFLILLGQSYQKLSGRYYTLKPLRDQMKLDWQGVLARGQEDGDMELKRAAEIALKGIPQAISDFYMHCHYVVNRLNGTRSRLVTLHNVHGVNTPMLSLPSSAFAAPQKFREWLLDSITGATWTAGERELNALQEDIGHEVAFKDVSEVPLRGYHAASGCWFFRDVVYTPEGKEIFADRHGIIWYRQKGGKRGGGEFLQPYKMSETDQEKQSFRHGEPSMHPEKQATDEEIGRLFQEVSAKLYDTVGGYGGYLAFGLVLSFAAGPEIYEHFNGAPGLWLHGETAQGKTSVALWLMRIWGFSTLKSGLALKDSTKVGLSIALQQYGHLPVFLEEFQPQADATTIEKMKNVFDRTSGSKKTFEDAGDRKILAGAIVTGIATCSDAQVRNRYAHVQVASANRLANHYDWFQAECERFFVLGRYLMRNRVEFARDVISSLREWMSSDLMKRIDERARLVYGAAYSAYLTMLTMLGIADEGKHIGSFRKHLIEYSGAMVQEVREQVNVNQFWRDLVDALKSDAFGQTPAERSKVFKVVENSRATPPLTPYQIKVGAEDPRKAWKSYLLYFQPGAVIDMLRRYKRLQGRELPLDRSDLRAQMSVRKYWVEPKSSNGHRQRFGHSSKTPELCWCIDMDLHELGRRDVTDEEFTASFYADMERGTFLVADEWIDPRRGDMFAILDAITSRVDANAQ